LLIRRQRQMCIRDRTNAKKIQKSHQANAPRQQKIWTAAQRQTERQPVTAPTQKAGFRVPKTVLWLIKH
jgi:hypothetical protein